MPSEYAASSTRPSRSCSSAELEHLTGDSHGAAAAASGGRLHGRTLFGTDLGSAASSCSGRLEVIAVCAAYSLFGPAVIVVNNLPRAGLVNMVATSNDLSRLAQVPAVFVTYELGMAIKEQLANVNRARNVSP